MPTDQLGAWLAPLLILVGILQFVLGRDGLRDRIVAVCGVSVVALALAVASRSVPISMDYAYAWLVPLFAGIAVCRFASLRAVWHGHVAATIGAGWIAGILIAAAATCWLGPHDTLHAFANGLPLICSFAFLVALLEVLVRRMAPRRAVESREGAVARSPQALALRALWWLLLAMIMWRLWLVGSEAALRPVFPWDAWSAWALKPKTWMLLGQAEPFVSMHDWLADPSSAVRTLGTWHYPETLAWIEIWFASAAGGWNEPLVDIAWCGALAAFAIAAYGYWRGSGLKPALAMALVYALVSLPLIDAHVALAGYADLWMAVTLGIATLAWSRWLIYRERGHWLLAVAFALCLPAIKLEGAIWLLAFSVVVVLDLLPPRWRWRVAAAIVLLGALGIAMGGFRLPMLGLGWVDIGWGYIRIPTARAFELSWHAVGGAMLASLFTLPNWHLFWYALPIVVALRWSRLRTDHAARALGQFVMLQLAFLFVLFFFTSAAAWAEDFTSVNRLILQIVPSIFVFVAVLLRNSDERSHAGLSIA